MPPLDSWIRRAAFCSLIPVIGIGSSRADEITVSKSVRTESLCLIREDLQKGPPLVFGHAEAPLETPDDVVLLDPMETTDKKIPDFFPPRPPETKFEEFVRTGTIWEKGRMRFWTKGDRGLMLDIRF